jgi:hypothetical protein
MFDDEWKRSNSKMLRKMNAELVKIARYEGIVMVYGNVKCQKLIIIV